MHFDGRHAWQRLDDVVYGRAVYECAARVGLHVQRDVPEFRWSGGSGCGHASEGDVYGGNIEWELDTDVPEGCVAVIWGRYKTAQG